MTDVQRALDECQRARQAFIDYVIEQFDYADLESRESLLQRFTKVYDRAEQESRI